MKMILRGIIGSLFLTLFACTTQNVGNTPTPTPTENLPTPTLVPTNTPIPTLTPTPAPSESDLIYQILADGKLPAWASSVRRLEELPTNYQIEDNYRSSAIISLQSQEIVPTVFPGYEYSSSLEFLNSGESVGFVAVYIFDNGSDAWKAWDRIATDIRTNVPPIFLVDRGETVAGSTCWDEECEQWIFQLAASIRNNPTIVWYASIIGEREPAIDAQNDLVNSTMDAIIDVIE